MGAVMGIFEDALSHHAIGINGVAKTVVGFVAASVGTRIDVENHTIRLILNFLLSLLSKRDVCLCLPHPAGARTGLDLVH
jgi:rod shape-determining protein MreD